MPGLSVTARDFATAAAKAAGVADPFAASPAVALPDNYDEAVDALARLRDVAMALAKSGGGPRIRVLVGGETSGVVATAFQQAGADVATCE